MKPPPPPPIPVEYFATEADALLERDRICDEVPDAWVMRLSTDTGYAYVVVGTGGTLRLDGRMR